MAVLEPSDTEEKIQTPKDLLLPYDEISDENSVNGKYYRFVLLGLDQPISSVMTNELAIGGGNQFSAKTELQERIPVIGKVTELTNKVRPVQQLRNSSSFTKNETSNTWTQSTRPTFTIDFTLIAHQASKAKTHVEWIKLLSSAVLPVSSKGGGLGPPNGYTNEGAGTLTLIVGEWFKARHLVMTSTSFTPSKQVMSNGFPLYWTCNITLEPYRMIDSGDFDNYFSTPTAYTVAQVQEAKKKDPNIFESFVAKSNDIAKSITG